MVDVTTGGLIIPDPFATETVNDVGVFISITFTYPVASGGYVVVMVAWPPPACIEGDLRPPFDVPVVIPFLMLARILI